MNIIKKYFTPGKETKMVINNSVNYEVTSQDHIDFANDAIEIFNPVLKKFGFKILKFKLTEFGTTIIWINGKRYVDLGANTHPHDAPNHYGIVLGEFTGEYYHYADLDCVGLWRLKAIQENLENVNDTPFPLGQDIKESLEKTKDDLLKYGKDFLEGDLIRFYNARNIQWNK